MHYANVKSFLNGRIVAVASFCQLCGTHILHMYNDRGKNYLSFSEFAFTKFKTPNERVRAELTERGLKRTHARSFRFYTTARCVARKLGRKMLDIIITAASVRVPN